MVTSVWWLVSWWPGKQRLWSSDVTMSGGGGHGRITQQCQFVLGQHIHCCLLVNCIFQRNFCWFGTGWMGVHGTCSGAKLVEGVLTHCNALNSFQVEEQCSTEPGLCLVQSLRILSGTTTSEVYGLYSWTLSEISFSLDHTYDELMLKTELEFHSPVSTVVVSWCSQGHTFPMWHKPQNDWETMGLYNTPSQMLKFI